MQLLSPIVAWAIENPAVYALVFRLLSNVSLGFTLKHQKSSSILIAPRYPESNRHFYSSLTLHFYSTPTFWKFATTVPSQYFALVRNMCFKWSLGGKELPHTSRSAKLSYDKRWEALRSFSGLKVLWLAFKFGWTTEHYNLMNLSNSRNRGWCL